MSTMTFAKIYEFLVSKWGKETAENVTTLIDHKITTDMENKSKTLATKDDISRLELKISDSRVEIIRWVVTLWIAQAAMVIGLFLSR